MPDSRGNRRLTGSHAKLWWNGEVIAEFEKVEFKVSINREDVQIGFDVDSKAVGQKGEWTMTLVKVYSRYEEIRENFKKGIDTRGQFISSLADPDSVGVQEERYSVDNCWFNDLPVVSYERGAVAKQEFSGGFTPSDMINLDKIA